jgi:hypothetical protein
VTCSSALQLDSEPRHRTSKQDFWVTWTLNALFNGLPAGHPRFLFKGGTSLSKAYGLISRFSEDIDITVFITVFREDIGQAASVKELESLSRKKRQARLDAIKDTRRRYIQNTLAQQFEELVQSTLGELNIEMNDPSVVVDLREQRSRHPVRSCIRWPLRRAL